MTPDKPPHPIMNRTLVVMVIIDGSGIRSRRTLLVVVELVRSGRERDAEECVQIHETADGSGCT